MLLPQKFYNRSTLQAAQDLLGCFLVRGPKGAELPAGSSAPFGRFKIVETEAYDGPRDLASHASKGRTERNGVMFGKPGIIYVYFTYGMHYMLNIVTGAKDYPAAVLIRAVESHETRNTKHAICDMKHVTGSANNKLPTNGPAKLTKYLGIDKSFNGLPIYVKKHGLWIESRERGQKPPKIARAARVGVDYAHEYKDKKWRFYIKDSKFVSKK